MIIKHCSTFLFFSLTTILLIVSCAQRDDGIGSRNNIFDPGAENWTENAPPEITASFDSLWADFNPSCTTGSVWMHLSGDDRNFPYDTLSGTVYVNSSVRKLPFFVKKENHSLLLDNVKPAASMRCSVIVYDNRKAATTRVFTLSAPASTPPQSPSAKVTSGSQYITISWQRIPQADFYTVYFSDTLYGSYRDSILVNQSQSSIITVQNNPSTYMPRYYILSVTGESGTSRSTDTLVGRRYSSDVYSPSISSISAGSYITHIALSIYSSYSSSIHHVELYRSTKDTSNFHLLTEVPFSGSYMNYNDSVKTSDTYYYKVTAIDNQGRCSYPSNVSSGYLYRLSAPSFSITMNVDFLVLKWYSLTNAAYYRIYRSSRSCPDSLEFVDTTSLLVYTDTLPTSETYYYSLSAVDRYGNEGFKSGCMQGKILNLPQPDSLRITKDFYPRHVALSWKKVTGADGYIVYNNLSANDIPLDTIFTNEFIDSLNGQVTRRYRVAAFNNKGVGVLSNSDYGSIISPMLTSAVSDNDSILLRWAPNSRATVYYVYRSLDTTSFKLIDSSYATSYSGLQVDFKTYFYRITIRVPEGVSYPGTFLSITRNLMTPENFKTKDLNNGVMLQWSSVEGAESYNIYRSQYSSDYTIYRTISDTFFIDTLSSVTPRYYYRVAAKNKNLTSPVSNAITGGMIARPLAPLFVSLTGQLFSIRLTWLIPAASSQPDSFRIYRSSTVNGTFVLVGSTRNLEYYDSVPDNLSYSYKISAYNSFGESAYSSTYSGSRVKPTGPTNVTASFLTSKDYIRISWARVNSVTQYGIYRALTTGNTYYYIGTALDSTVYYDSTCDVNTDYYYTVTSVVSGINSTGSQDARGIRLGPPTVTEIMKSHGITIIWKPLPYTIQRYYIYKATTLAGPYSKVDSTTGTSYFDASYIGNYYYKISSFYTVESDLSTEVTTTNITGPTAPRSIIATQGTETNIIKISWSASENAIGYRLYRAPTDSFNRNIMLVAEISSTLYRDTVQSDSIYYYRVKAFNNYGENGLAAGAAAGYRYPTQKPYPPTNLYIGTNTGSIDIGWYEASTAIGFDKYALSRATSPDGPFELLTTTNDTYFSDVPPEKSPTVYWYRVSSVNQIGASAPSEMISSSLRN